MANTIDSRLVDYGAFYHPENHSTLPTLREALQSLPQLGDDEDDITENIRQVFLEHNVQARYGLVLLHRRQDLRGEERLVNHEGAVQPWDVGESNDPSLRIPGGYIMPQSFRSIAGRMLPYDFCFSTRYTGHDLPFLIDAAHLLQSLQVEEIFGIRRLDGFGRGIPLGFRQGYSIARLTPREEATSENPDDSLAETMWVFSAGGDLVAYSPLSSTPRDNSPEKTFRQRLRRFWRRCRNLFR